jgi:CubicO group peptidase (beta-lactamase class C family)
VLESELDRAVAARLRSDIAAGAAPGVAAAVWRPGRPVEVVVSGVDGAGRALRPDTLFPVASVTKLAVALAVLRLADEGRLTVSGDLAALVPEAAAAVPGVTVRSLLAHTSGLPVEPPARSVPYAPGLDWPRIAAACLETAPERPPGSGFRYGNVEYGLLALVVERATGRAFPEALDALVFRPLRIEAYLGVEPPRAPAVVAGQTGEHVGTPLESFNTPFWRSLCLPWAGLVTTAEGALALVRAFAGWAPDLLAADTRAAATRDQTDGLPTPTNGPIDFLRGPWGLGPELRGDKPYWAPPEAGTSSFGHIGASGCVAWAAPEAGVAWAALSSRVLGSPTHWLLTRAAVLARAILRTAA